MPSGPREAQGLLVQQLAPAGTDPAPDTAAAVNPESSPAAGVNLPGRGPLVDKLAALRATEGEDKLALVKQVWVQAADEGVSDEVLDALLLAARDRDPVVAWRATQAIEDLERVREAQEAAAAQRIEAESANPVTAVAADPLAQDALNRGDASTADPTASTGAAAGEPEPVLSPDAERVGTADFAPARQPRAKPLPAGLADQAMYAGDARLRAEAIREVAMHRTQEAADVLIDTLRDSAAANRRDTVQALWMAAADGRDEHGRIRGMLQYATLDSDPAVARMARKAVDDLTALERRSQESSAPALVNDATTPPLPMQP